MFCCARDPPPPPQHIHKHVHTPGLKYSLHSTPCRGGTAFKLLNTFFLFKLKDKKIQRDSGEIYLRLFGRNKVVRWSRAHLNIGALVDVETSRHSYKQPVTAGVIFLHDLQILYKCTYLKTNETGRGSSTGIWIEKVRQDRLGVVAVKCFQQQQVQRRHRLGNAGRIIYIQRITSNEELLVATPTSSESLRLGHHHCTTDGNHVF